MSNSIVEVNFDNAYIEDGKLFNASITRRVTFVAKSEREDSEKGPQFNREILLQVSVDGVPLIDVLNEAHKSETISLRGYFRPKYDSDYCTRFFSEQPTELHDGQELPLLAWHPENSKSDFFELPKSTEEQVEEATEGKSAEEINRMIERMQQKAKELEQSSN